MVDEESLPAAVRSATSHRSAYRPRQIGVGPLPTASFFTCYFKVVLSMMRKHHEPLRLLRFMKVQFVCLTCYKTVANPPVDGFWFLDTPSLTRLQIVDNNVS